ncbi:multicomponent K+:H+ antiporter subunit G [Mesorhizobium soli]|uniref:monovalent cation/H(+) antiporter subunit G n=1 Tax=Pseudaminobacter soli (ex Li et al. 2025) TaxID=1295366 RepID=UPI0024730E5B|nr:monovalent cation/H(+) antiporter subunit G [Mesorhizobium soli]MDH6233937.1 multicomponent K+:H+ antiporter subunit G [Mesorhizobium soli]
MTDMADLPIWAALLVAFLVLLGAVLTLIGAVGLLRLRSFYERVHAPTLGTTFGAGGILVASMIFFSMLETRPVLHEVLISVFITVTTPVTLMLLARAALYRDRAEGAECLPVRHEVGPANAGPDPSQGD